MSAIAGFWSLGSSRDPADSCRTMVAALADYGPDDCAIARLGPLALGRNLYRLLPEDEWDRQPLVGGDGRFALVCDLRLDNRDELAAALGLVGTASLADSALLLAALERWGEEAVDRLAGDYAFAWFDSRASSLVLARDPLGQRPLFWHRGDGYFAFASMPRGFHALAAPTRRADAEAMLHFVGGLPQRGPGTFYEGVARVEPGHVLVVTPAGERSRRFWQPRRRELRLKRFDDYVDAYRETLDRAVAARLRGAGGTVASHLSGGWDSSAVAATAARLLAPTGGTVLAFTSVPRAVYGGESPRNRFSDEGPIAAATAAFHPNIVHRPIENEARSPIADLDRSVAAYDRPLYNLCNHVWLAQIRDAARASGARILLTGEIGNWTISAAPHNLLADYLRQGRVLAWAREAGLMLAGRKARLRGIAANSFGPWLPDGLWRRLRRLSSVAELSESTPLHPDLRESVARRQEAEKLGPARRPADNFAETVQALQEMDFGQYRKGVLAGWGLDKRDPSADTRLIDFCLSLPIDLLLKKGVRRPLARAALADRLPPAVLDERRKGYQAADWAEGISRDLPGISALIDRIAADPAASAIVDVGLLRTLVRDWPEGGWSDPRVIARYRVALLTGLSAGHFIVAAR
ncbi:MAG: asparagine synthase [Alphaproteobacteria bacterium]|nr:asparagine synthase [Alphaproteobacteria bacterium]